MCGINGILAFEKGSGNMDNVVRMNKSMAHRGPDGEGVWGDDLIALGHRRLAIIDLSSAGKQPMLSADQNLVLVFNGEIYNYLELRLELSGYPFHSNTDSEVILAAYQRWGKECLTRLRGMFAFALWDRHRQELLLARDRLGKKPLYYFTDNRTLLFASELRSLLVSGIVPRKLDGASLADYLRYQTVHAPDTMVEGVKMLMPGQYLMVHAGKASAKGLTIDQKTYWNISNHHSTLSPVGKSGKEIQTDVRNLLYRAVERRLISDVPFGAFLSGGIDSSVVVGMMSQVMTQPVNTFSVTFEEKHFSEASFSKQISEKFHTNHHPIHLRASDLLSYLPEALNSMDHPSGDGLNTWVISKVTKEAGISMALSGIGGDELFAGYDLFKRLYYLQKFRVLGHLPAGMRKLSFPFLDMGNPSMAKFKAKELMNLKNWSFQNTYPIIRQTLPDDIVSCLIRMKTLPENKVTLLVQQLLEEERAVQDKPEKDLFLSMVTKAELSSYLQNVLLRDTDQMSMCHALEVRAPFLDYELVEYVLQVSDAVKFPHTPKQLLTESVGDLIPESVVNRKKMGFVFPWEVWMRNELKAFCETCLFSFKGHSLVNYETVDGLWKRFLQRDPLIGWSRIWPMVVLGQWMMENGIE